MNREEIAEKIKESASKKSYYDDGNPDLMSACGGNYDDAFSIGFDAGEISLARTLLPMFTEYAERKCVWTSLHELKWSTEVTGWMRNCNGVQVIIRGWNKNYDKFCPACGGLIEHKEG